MPTATFPEILNGLLFAIEPPCLPVPGIIAIGVLGGGCEPQSWGRGGRRGSGVVPLERALMTSYTPSIVTFSLSVRVWRDIAAFVLQHATFSHPHLYSRWMAFWQRRAKVLG